MRLRGKRVFISGGNGVIGNTLVEKLLEEGAILFVGDLKPHPENWSKEIIYRQGDLNYISQEEISDFQPEYFFHLAATFERSAETYEFWEENYRHNVRLSNHLMTLMKDVPTLKKVIFASSYLIYDPKLYNFKVPVEKAFRLKETDPIYPRNLTGAAKLNHEIELRFLGEFKEAQFKTISARIYRSYGKNSRDIISRWIRSLLKNEPLTLYKKEGFFDYIYAGDVAEGLIRLAIHEKAEGIYNLGRDNARRVDEVVNILKKHFPSLQFSEEKSDIDYEGSQANMDYFFNNIGWKPGTDLEVAIPKMIEFEKNKQSYFSEIPEFSVLVTSISRKVSMLKSVKLACKKINSNITLIGADVSDDVIGKYFVDQFWKMPFIKDLSFDIVLNYCKENNVKLIIPSRDGELPFWSSIKTKLKENGISVLISGSKSIEITLDKVMFHDILLQNKLPIIPTSTTIDGIPSSDFYVVKERFGAGSLSIGIHLSKEDAITHSKQLENPIFQPYVSGTEISIDLFVDTLGTIKGIVPRKRDLVINGESQITTTFKNEAVEEVAQQMVQTLEIRGHAVLQMFIDSNDKIHIIECNSRFGGASSLSIRYGLDTFYWAILESIGQSVTSYKFHAKNANLKQVRYADDIYVKC